MTHYVCTGTCGGEASRPGVCQAEDCTKEGQPLEECDCEDGIHENLVMDTAEEDEETEEYEE